MVPPELMAFAGAFAGGAIAGLASASVRWLKLDQRLASVAHDAAADALKRHEHDCPWRAVAANHVSGEHQLLTPSGRYPLKP